jgi:uncharacterized repeat protein (TIGR02543 family)
VTAPVAPTKTGYAFSGWYTDIALTSAYTFTTMPAASITLYAAWIETIVEDDSSDYTFILKTDDTYEVSDYLGTNTVLVVPSSYLDKAVTSIGTSAFQGCSSLTSITIPSSVTYIGRLAFHDCISLTSITFETGSQLTTIGPSAFYFCLSLTSITIPLSVTYISYDAFRDCCSLTSITIPSNVITIRSGAFWRCDSLTIYTPLHTKPSGWDSDWNPSNCFVVWGYES